MITLTTGNLLESDAEALVNTVNAVGVMGKGIALQFKKAFPENFKRYAEACQRNEVRVGAMFVTEEALLDGKKTIINFPTKKHWKGKSHMDDIERGLEDLVRVVRNQGLHSVAVPPLGCGLGGLPWDEVREKIEQAFADLPDVDVRLYPPRGAPDASSMPNRTPKPKMTKGKASFLGVISQYLDMILDSELTLLESQKLSYFLQLSGEPLLLQFVKWHYGPYADNLRHVLNQLDGHFIKGWGEGMNKPLIRIQLLEPTREEIAPFMDEEISGRITRVLDLVEGFDSPYGLELLGSVHWVLAEEFGPNPSADDVHAAIRAWTIRKSRMFKPHHIKVAMERLQTQEWI